MESFNVFTLFCVVSIWFTGSLSLFLQNQSFEQKGLHTYAQMLHQHQ